MIDDKNIRGHMAIFVANILWGLNISISKTVLSELSALTVTTLRMVGAALAFWIFSLFLPKEHVEHQDMLKLFFAALLGVVLNQGMFMFGLSHTTSADASIVATATPIITMIVAAIYLKEPITNVKVIGVFIGAIGALILIISCQPIDRHPGNMLGGILCVIAQISFAFYLTVYRNLISKYSPITIAKWLFIYASICFIPFSYADVAAIDFNSFSASLWLRLCYVIVGGTFLAYICLMSSQRFLRPTIVGMYNYIQPLMVVLLAIIIGIDSFDWEKLIAIVLVLGGVFCVTSSKSKEDLDRLGKDL